jgi:hypothetical protein
MQNIELYGTRVAPLVREQIGAASLTRTGG